MKAKLALLLCLSIAGIRGLSAAPKPKRDLPFDRLRKVEEFFDLVYPDLKTQRGIVFLSAVEFHAITGAQDQVNFIPCYPGSGIPLATEPLPNYCAGTYLPHSSSFLSASFWFSKRFPIRWFGAAGSFVNEKVKAVQEEIAKHPEWTTQEERLDALRRANPRFGPEKKEEFLKTVPARAIYEFTGCHLDLSTAHLVATWEEAKPDPPLIQVVWSISGHQGRHAKPETDRCWATFEPFDGKLLSIQQI